MRLCRKHAHKIVKSDLNMYFDNLLTLTTSFQWIICCGVVYKRDENYDTYDNAFPVLISTREALPK